MKPSATKNPQTPKCQERLHFTTSLNLVNHEPLYHKTLSDPENRTIQTEALQDLMGSLVLRPPPRPPLPSPPAGDALKPQIATPVLQVLASKAAAGLNKNKTITELCQRLLTTGWTLSPKATQPGSPKTASPEAPNSRKHRPTALTIWLCTRVVHGLLLRGMGWFKGWDSSSKP